MHSRDVPVRPNRGDKRKLAILLPVVSERASIDPQQSGALSCKRVTTFHACRAEANLAFCDRVLLGSGGIACRSALRMPSSIPPMILCASTQSTSARPTTIVGPGRGVYLGRAWSSPPPTSSARPLTPTNVRIAGMDLPAHAIREGNFERVDLTLLSIDEQKLPIYLQMRRMPLCEKPPWPGEPVIVAIPEGTARSQVMSPQLLPFNMRRKFSTVISDVATTGNSGSGVFDAGNKCLLGIMSRKIYVHAE